MLKQLALATFAAALLAVQSPANAGINCPPWACTSNGTQLTGMSFEVSYITGVQLPQSSEAAPAVVLAQSKTVTDAPRAPAPAADDKSDLNFQIQIQPST